MLPMIKAKYLARAIACSFGNSSKGNKQIAVTFEIVDHPDFTGVEITWMGTFTDASEDITLEALMNMGWQGDSIDDLADLDAAGCAQSLPDVISLACEPDTYEGTTRLKAKWVNKQGNGFAFKEPLARDDLKGFAAQMKNKIRGMRASGGQRPRTAANGSGSRDPHPNAPGNRDKDDLPF